VSRASRRRRGRPYQPLPDRSSNRWLVRLIIVTVGVILVFGSLALFAGAQ
jgi:hypothetical protein